MTISTDQMKYYVIKDANSGRCIGIDPVTNRIYKLTEKFLTDLFAAFDCDVEQTPSLTVYTFDWWDDSEVND